MVKSNTCELLQKRRLYFFFIFSEEKGIPAGCSELLITRLKDLGNGEKDKVLGAGGFLGHLDGAYH